MPDPQTTPDLNADIREVREAILDQYNMEYEGNQKLLQAFERIVEAAWQKKQ